jgi:sugar phosphate permease
MLTGLRLFTTDLSFWYTYTELATRGAIFYSTSALAGSFNGLIAYGIEKNLAGHRGWEPWQWLYLVEGVLPIGCSLILLLLLPGTPEKKHFLFTKEERELAIRRSRRAFNPEDAKLRPRFIIKPLLKPHFWLLSAIYAFNHFSVSSLSNFLPAIIQVRSDCCPSVRSLVFADRHDRDSVTPQSARS